MFVYDVIVYVLCVYVEVIGEELLELWGIEVGVGVNDVVGWEVGEFVCDVGECVDGVGDDEECCFGGVFY